MSSTTQEKDSRPHKTDCAISIPLPRINKMRFLYLIVQAASQELLVVTDGNFFLEVLDEFDPDLCRLVASQSIRSIRDELHFNAYLNLCESMSMYV